MQTSDPEHYKPDLTLLDFWQSHIRDSHKGMSVFIPVTVLKCNVWQVVQSANVHINWNFHRNHVLAIGQVYENKVPN